MTGDPSALEGYWAAGRGHLGGGADVRATEEGIRRNVTSEWRTHGADMDLRAGQGQQREVNWTRDGSYRLARGTT